MKPFTQLTGRGQARRLRQVALNALELYDLQVARLRLITNSFNCIFRIDTVGGEKYILRVTLPEGGHNRESTHAELAWMAALSRDTDLSIPAPLAAHSGEMLVEVEAEGVPQSRLCTPLLSLQPCVPVLVE